MIHRTERPLTDEEHGQPEHLSIVAAPLDGVEQALGESGAPGAREPRTREP